MKLSEKIAERIDKEELDWLLRVEHDDTEEAEEQYGKLEEIDEEDWSFGEIDWDINIMPDHAFSFIKEIIQSGKTMEELDVTETKKLENAISLIEGYKDTLEGI